ncbi:MAG: hypothetical protein A2W95_02155 [Bacteroidetes bacterium GWA2_40_14]|nr:MAG: hypothetical protein A2W95_02155 [Bacteroidetes bacterium GWA2_40_14]
MIPIRLTIQGLYSYQEKQTIDFTKLTSAGIFGIFGSVGSGKSSILEAITFALYGETERLNQKGDDRNYNMMNLKSEELLIEFVFKTGLPFNEYMALVKGRRNSKRFDEVKTLERTAYRKIQEGWGPILVEQLEEIIGLTYENFKRTIIIPQGKFQEFLQLTAAKRSEMMKELFHLQKYELSDEVGLLEKNNDAHMNQLMGMIQGLSEVTEELIQQKRSELSEQSKQLHELKVQLESMQQKSQEMSQLKTLHERMAHLESVLKNLETKKPEMEVLAKNLAEYEFCLIHFHPLLASIQEFEKRITNFQNEIRNYTTELDTTKKQNETNILELNQIRPTFENIPNLKKQVEELGKVLQIKKLQAEYLNLSKRVSEGEQFLIGFQLEIGQKNAKWETQIKELKQWKNQRPNVMILNKVREWYLINNQLDKQQNELQTEDQRIQKEKETQKVIFDKILEEWTLSGFETLLNRVNFTQTVSERIADIESDIQQNELEMEHFAVQAKLAAFASQLSGGSPCPLCGSLEHPHIFKLSDADEHLATLRQTKSELKDRLNQCRQWLLQGQQVQIQEQAILTREDEHHKDVARSQQQVANHLQLFEWPDFSTPELLNQAFDSLTVLEKQIHEGEHQNEQLQKELDQDLQKLETYKKKVDEFRHQIIGCLREEETLKAQIRYIIMEEWLPIQETQLQSDIQNIEQTIIATEKRYTLVFNLQEQLQKKIEQLAQTIETRKNDVEQEKSSLKQKYQELADKITRSAFTSEEKVKEILMLGMDLEKGKQQLESYRQQLAISQQQLMDTRQAMNGAFYDGIVHQQLKEQLEDANQKTIEKNKVCIQLENSLQKMDMDFKKLQELNHQKGQLEARASNLKTLKQLFKANGFVNYISTVYLQNLCADANDRFYRLSGQRLSLEITEDNSFQVRDFMNDGKVRHVKTLSGGQTFQAALSLALALADSVHRDHGTSENFFFLDEGFGSLDKESLQLVFDTLKTLRKENRMVGIISHVDELQQEIDTCLKITNSENSGSLITLGY